MVNRPGHGKPNADEPQPKGNLRQLFLQSAMLKHLENRLLLVNHANQGLNLKFKKAAASLPKI